MTPLSNKQVGEKIRAVESIEKSQSEIAEQLGMSKSNYAKYERGEHKNLDRELIIKIAQVLSCPIAKIIGLEDNDYEYPPMSQKRLILMDKIQKATDKDIYKFNQLLEIIENESENE